MRARRVHSSPAARSGLQAPVFYTPRFKNLIRSGSVTQQDIKANVGSEKREKNQLSSTHPALRRKMSFSVGLSLLKAVKPVRGIPVYAKQR